MICHTLSEVTTWVNYINHRLMNEHGKAMQPIYNWLVRRYTSDFPRVYTYVALNAFNCSLMKTYVKLAFRALLFIIYMDAKMAGNLSELQLISASMHLGFSESVSVYSALNAFNCTQKIKNSIQFWVLVRPLIDPAKQEMAFLSFSLFSLLKSSETRLPNILILSSTRLFINGSAST